MLGQAAGDAPRDFSAEVLGQADGDDLQAVTEPGAAVPPGVKHRGTGAGGEVLVARRGPLGRGHEAGGHAGLGLAERATVMSQAASDRGTRPW